MWISHSERFKNKYKKKNHGDVSGNDTSSAVHASRIQADGGRKWICLYLHQGVLVFTNGT
jgi:hypothetical protein